MRIDAHQHFWHFNLAEFGWIDDSMAVLRRDFLPNDLKPELDRIGFDGSMDSNILIRTFVLGGGWIQCSVGGGIVADSMPEQEYEETWHKAEGMLRALSE